MTWPTQLNCSPYVSLLCLRCIVTFNFWLDICLAWVFFAYLATISLLSRLYRRDIWISLHISSCLNKQQYKIIQIPVYIRISMYILFLWDSVVFWWITNDFIQASLGEQFSSLLSISNALQVKNYKSQNFLKVVMKAKLQQLWDNKLLLLQF